MLDFSLAFLPFFIIAIANFILSWLFYSPVVPWFKAWAEGVGVDPAKTEMTEQEKKEFPMIMAGAVLSSFLLSYGLQVFVNSVGATSFVSGGMVGLVAWFAFALTHSLNTRFEGRKPVVLIINNVHYILTYFIFAGITAIM